MMKNINRLAIMVLIILWAGMLNVVNAEFFDIPETADYKEAVDFLSAIGIIDGYNDGSYKPEQTVTRAEFVSVIIRLAGVKEAANRDMTNKSGFSDVDNDYWAAGTIDTAYRLGIVNGGSDQKFMPDDEVAFEEAVKMVVCVLGYDVYANQKGGYPLGYLATAVEKGLTNGLDEKTTDALTRASVARLIYNAADVNMMMQTVFGGKSEYNIIEGKTLLTEKLKIYKIEGQVTGNSRTRLRSVSVLKDNEIEIDGDRYIIDEPSITDMLGINVRAYYKQDRNDTEKHIIHISPKSNRNHIVKIEDVDLQGYADRVLSYWNKNGNGSVYNLTVSAGAAVIYNGAAITQGDEYDESLFLTDQGGIECIDSDNDGQYDVIKITNYDDYVIYAVSKDDGIISDRYGAQNLTLKTSSADEKIEIKDGSGNIVSVDELKPWDVLSVKKSVNEKYIEVIASGDAVTGTVMEIFTEGRRTSVRLEGEKFDLSKNFEQRGELGFGIGDNVTFYLNAFGKIAAVRVDNTGEVMFGYLAGAAVPGSGIAGAIEFKILSQNNEMLYVKGAGRINVDDKVYSDHRQVLGLLTDGDEVKISKRLVRFSLNDEDEVKEIDTEDRLNGEGSSTLRLTYPLDEYSQRFDTNVYLQYKTASGCFGGKVNISEKTNVFIIPSAPDAEDKEYRVTNKNGLSNDGNYNINAYSIRENGLINDVVVVYLGDENINVTEDNTVLLVDKIAKYYNEDGQVVEKLYGLQDGKQVTLIAKPDYSWNNKNIKSGDVIRVHKDINGLADNSSVVFSFSDRGNIAGNITGNYSDKYRIVYGNIHEKEENVFKLKQNNSDTYENHSVLSSSTIYVYDTGLSGNNRVKIGSISDLEDVRQSGGSGSEVLIHTRYAEIRAIIIYR